MGLFTWRPNMANRIDVYEKITATVIETIERTRELPWRKTWNAESGAPRGIRGNLYRGVNVLLTGCQPYASPFWMTYRQAQERGGNVIKGQKGTSIVFWKFLKRRDKATGKEKTFPMARLYSVFNAAQVEGVEIPTLDTAARDHTPIEAAELIAAGYRDGPAVRHGGDSACYSPPLDCVNVPTPESFESAEYYYSTLFHELAHSTGHHSRLERDGVCNHASFGDHRYSKEELVAEFCAAFLMGTAGLEAATIENSTAYLKHWIGKLRNDPKLLVHGAQAAQKAADRILGTTPAKYGDD
jgi:antirestriction protein ArdC